MEQSSDVLSRAAAIISRCGQVGAYSNQFRVLADQLRLLMENMGCEMSAVKTGKLTILFLELNSLLDEMDKPYKPSATNIRDETSVNNADETAGDGGNGIDSGCFNSASCRISLKSLELGVVCIKVTLSLSSTLRDFLIGGCTRLSSLDSGRSA